MNLLQRLKPKVLQAMENDINKYPTLIAAIKRHLENENGSPMNLSIDTAMYVCQYNNTNLEIGNLLDCFNKE